MFVYSLVVKKAPPKQVGRAIEEDIRAEVS
jgi:hypothetical protein